MKSPALFFATFVTIVGLGVLFSTPANAGDSWRLQAEIVLHVEGSDRATARQVDKAFPSASSCAAALAAVPAQVVMEGQRIGKSLVIRAYAARCVPLV